MTRCPQSLRIFTPPATFSSLLDIQVALCGFYIPLTLWNYLEFFRWCSTVNNAWQLLRDRAAKVPWHLLVWFCLNIPSILLKLGWQLLIDCQLSTDCLLGLIVSIVILLCGICNESSDHMCGACLISIAVQKEVWCCWDSVGKSITGRMSWIRLLKRSMEEQIILLLESWPGMLIAITFCMQGIDYYTIVSLHSIYNVIYSIIFIVH